MEQVDIVINMSREGSVFSPADKNKSRQKLQNDDVEKQNVVIALPDIATIA